jgi:hypothetical protein
MYTPRQRSAFTPDALAKVSTLFDEVWNELLLDGVLTPSADVAGSRERLARTLFSLARAPWTDAQIRQLLIRAFRNDAARLQRAAS